jgi:hypothetical protein
LKATSAENRSKAAREGHPVSMQVVIAVNIHQTAAMVCVIYDFQFDEVQEIVTNNTRSFSPQQRKSILVSQSDKYDHTSTLSH